MHPFRLAPAGALRPRPARSRVYNPDYEKHGWQSTHTAVEVLHPDLPFLVDSVRMELNRRGYSIHTLQTNVLSVRRCGQGRAEGNPAQG
ncbi:NAD-glutamate dehydrogenase [Pseudomonas aeruginosa]|nr:NAD-glutamate dehydrogenase [Pseudomonas aeruginosa]